MQVSRVPLLLLGGNNPKNHVGRYGAGVLYHNLPRQGLGLFYIAGSESPLGLIQRSLALPGQSEDQIEANRQYLHGSVHGSLSIRVRRSLRRSVRAGSIDKQAVCPAPPSWSSVTVGSRQ